MAALSRALDEACTDRLFEFLDLRAECRLRDVRRLCRLREIPRACIRDELRELLDAWQFHANPFCYRKKR